MTRTFHPDADPWLTARALLCEFGDEAKEEVWRRACALAREGRTGEMAAMLALMKAVNALGRSRDPKAAIH